MGDEGIGVHVVRYLEKQPLPAGVVCLDGGTAGVNLLEPMQEAENVLLIDATLDGAPAGTVRRLRPRYSTDYPKTLTAHDIGLKDLLDVLYLLGEVPPIVLFAISIASLQKVTVEMSVAMRQCVPGIAATVLAECTEILRRQRRTATSEGA